MSERMAARRLYRSVGVKEMELILKSGSTRFPPRRPEQPIFYPVTNLAYAQEISRDWNTNDPVAGYAGFVTVFEVEKRYVEKFQECTVGAQHHRELWVPAEELDEFNDHIVERIRLEEAFYGELYTGPEPEPLLLKGRTARDQIPVLAAALDYNAIDFFLEVNANWITVALNFRYWQRADFSEAGISEPRKREILSETCRAWRREDVELPC